MYNVLLKTSEQRVLIHPPRHSGDKTLVKCSNAGQAVHAYAPLSKTTLMWANWRMYSICIKNENDSLLLLYIAIIFVLSFKGNLWTFIEIKIGTLHVT